MELINFSSCNKRNCTSSLVAFVGATVLILNRTYVYVFSHYYKVVLQPMGRLIVLMLIRVNWRGTEHNFCFIHSLTLPSWSQYIRLALQGSPEIPCCEFVLNTDQNDKLCKALEYNTFTQLRVNLTVAKFAACAAGIWVVINIKIYGERSDMVQQNFILISQIHKDPQEELQVWSYVR